MVPGFYCKATSPNLLGHYTTSLGQGKALVTPLLTTTSCPVTPVLTHQVIACTEWKMDSSNALRLGIKGARERGYPLQKAEIIVLMSAPVVNSTRGESDMRH
ncbi:hypothetical protein KIL84_020959 [Mauremys mutica]|uniref:Uncharacterized protein n=1 Tax=Mauremys mutica TaxID=74926 RepID=A0A9D3XBY7_9SAUR|nr:hypothetical protein KIL84_020959 [Mauremys mutica]